MESAGKTFTRLPPHSEDAERSLLGAILLEGDVLNAVLPLVSIYVRDILGASPGEAQLLPALLLLSTTMMALPIGAVRSAAGTCLGSSRC